MIDYSSFLSTPAGRAWGRLGARRRAGVCAPLFSLRSRRSVGVGEIPDLLLLGDWCLATEQSIIQLLPLNDTGFDFTPYSAQSSFALDPMYLALDRLRGVRPASFSSAVDDLRKKFPHGPRVDYGVKAAKLELLWRMFRTAETAEDADFAQYRENHGEWLKDYALFKTLKEKFGQKRWEEWDAPFRRRDPEALAEFEWDNAETVLFHKWVQWQLHEQLADVRRVLNERGLVLMGDLPFLTARDSADVWTFQSSFKLDEESGAPPDMYSEKGQRWGMPPYDWAKIESEGWRYVRYKLRCSEDFYDIFRIDHVIGVFRIFTIPASEPAANGALNGRFDPPDRDSWESHGRRVLTAMIESSHMLPCGEDLGDVPVCSDRVLAEMGVPGLNVQRWTRAWKKDKSFTPADAYRANACAVLSTHDASLAAEWWAREAEPEEKRLFLAFLGGGRADMPPDEAVRRALEKAAESAAVFSIQLVQDYWSAGGLLPGDPSLWRVNMPGIVAPSNWSVVLPRPLEDWGDFPINAFLADLHKRTGRV